MNIKYTPHKMGTGLTRSIRSAFNADSEFDGCSFITIAKVLRLTLIILNKASLTGLGGL